MSIVDVCARAMVVMKARTSAFVNLTIRRKYSRMEMAGAVREWKRVRLSLCVLQSSAIDPWGTCKCQRTGGVVFGRCEPSNAPSYRLVSWGTVSDRSVGNWRQKTDL